MQRFLFQSFYAVILLIGSAQVGAQNFWIPAEDFELHTHRDFEGVLRNDSSINKPVVFLEAGEQIRIILGVDSELADFIDDDTAYEVCAFMANDDPRVTNSVRVKHFDNSTSIDHDTENENYRNRCSSVASLGDRVLSAGLKVLSSQGRIKVRGISVRPHELDPQTEKLVVLIANDNIKLEGATKEHQLHVVGPNGVYYYKWGNSDRWDPHTIDMDVNDEKGLIVVGGGGRGNINNEVLLYNYQGEKMWETESNGNSQGTIFYKGLREEPMIAVGFHDNKVEARPDPDTEKLTNTRSVLGFYTRDLDGELLDWNPQFPAGGGDSPFEAGNLNVWRMFGDEVNNRLFVMGEFASVRTTDGVRSKVPVSRLALYEQNNDGSFPEEPTPMPRFGASWFESSKKTKHVGNPWDIAQSDSHYYIGGHSFDYVEDLDGELHMVNSLVRLRKSDFSLDTSFIPQFGPVFVPGITDENTSVVVRAVETYQNQLIVGGRFESANGETRSNIAAFNMSTERLDSRFQDLSVDKEVYSIDIDGDFAYIAGNFGSITDNNGKHVRKGLACIDLRNNTVTDWNPTSSIGDVTRINKVRIIEASIR